MSDKWLEGKKGRPSGPALSHLFSAIHQLPRQPDGGELLRVEQFEFLNWLVARGRVAVVGAENAVVAAPLERFHIGARQTGEAVRSQRGRLVRAVSLVVQAELVEAGQGDFAPLLRRILGAADEAATQAVRVEAAGDGHRVGQHSVFRSSHASAG